MARDGIGKKLFNYALFLLVLFCNLSSYAITYSTRLCSTGKISCIRLQNGATWNVLFPNPQQRYIAQRLNRMNTQVYGGMVLAVPDPRAGLLDYAPFPDTIQPTGQRQIIVDPNQLAWAAYDEYGRLLRWGPASAGKNYCPDTDEYCKTPTGGFSIYQKGGGDCVSTIFPLDEGGAPMPWCMFFNGGYALHGSYEVPGFNASHGCVRIFPEDAFWLNIYFAHPGTRVIIHGY